MLSNQHFEEELDRLLTQNGLLLGSSCGPCGKRYLEAPEEFVFNGANGKPAKRNGAKGKAPRTIGMKAGARARARSVRVIHKPCRGKPGAGFTVSSDHRRQQNRADNIQVLTLLANGAGAHDLRRILRPPRGETEPGISRIYDRIFWLERVLLAFEQAQLKAWRKRVERQRKRDKKPYVHARIAHDDISVGVNRETRADRRITQLNCAVSADIRSGYVFRCDVHFDPAVDPVETVERAYFGENQDAALRKVYSNSQKTFTAPLMAFQRPTGRFDERALFAAAESRLRLFAGRTAKALDAKDLPFTPEARDAVRSTTRRADNIEFLCAHRFNLVGKERDRRNSFDDIMTRDTYTKAASLAALKTMVPSGKLTMVGEQKAAMARVIPHIFREEILADRLEWAVVGFDKKATIGKIEAGKNAFNESLIEWRQSHPSMTYWDALQSWTADNLTPAVRCGRDGSISRWPILNFAANAFPRLWLRSPVRKANEINKTVGFPILSPRYRAAFKRLGSGSAIDDPDLREAITRRVIMAPLHPASTFMNAARERLSIVQRAGGRGARKGPSNINGAVHSPRVLIALTNIWRVHCNDFDRRTYTTPTDQETQADPAEIRMWKLPIRGTDESNWSPFVVP